MTYAYWLVGLSVLVATLERLFPAREQPVLRRRSWSDAIYLLFNGHLLGLILYGLAHPFIVPVLDDMLTGIGWKEVLYFDAASVFGWSVALQAIVALVVVDFLQWLVHNALHRSARLWSIHQIHHSVEDGEMDWIVSFRFSWLEPVVYKSVSYFPIMWFGFVPEALFVHAVVGTLSGHLNHANLSWDYGPFRYLLNNPKMHMYHHAHDAPNQGQNFGIVFSAWDYLFGTAHLPKEPCEKIGFPGMKMLPDHFFGQLVWPLFGAEARVRKTG